VTSDLRLCMTAVRRTQLLYPILSVSHVTLAVLRTTYLPPSLDLAAPELVSLTLTRVNFLEIVFSLSRSLTMRYLFIYSAITDTRKFGAACLASFALTCDASLFITKTIEVFCLTIQPIFGD